MTRDQFNDRQNEILDNTIDHRFHRAIRNAVMNMSRDDDDYEDLLNNTASLAEDLSLALAQFCLAKSVK